MAMAHWQTEIVAEMMPTHFAISFLGTPMNSTISGWDHVRTRDSKDKIDGKTYKIRQDRCQNNWLQISSNRHITRNAISIPGSAKRHIAINWLALSPKKAIIYYIDDLQRTMSCWTGSLGRLSNISNVRCVGSSSRAEEKKTKLIRATWNECPNKCDVK